MKTFLKTALILDTNKCPYYLYDIYLWSLDREDILISHILFTEDSIKKKESNFYTELIKKFFSVKKIGFFNSIKFFLLRLIVFLEMIKFKKKADYNFNKTVDIDGINIKKIFLKSQKINGNKYCFYDNDIKKIKSENFDLIIRGTDKILSGDILNSSKFGILSVHHGDYQHNRGGPAGFWEVYYKFIQTGFTIQLLSEVLDSGQILFLGKIPTQNYYTLNKQKLYLTANIYLKIIIEKFIDNSVNLNEKPSVQDVGKIYKFPKNLDVIKYTIYIFVRYLYLKFNFLFTILFTIDPWSVGYIDNECKNNANSSYKKIPNPKNGFLADPFLLEKDAETYCFLEEYEYKRKKGKIAVYKYYKNKFNKLGDAIDEKFHLSFPNIFWFENDLYMCPETSMEKKIIIYKCIDFPLKWKQECIALENSKYSDNLIFCWNGLWWLLTSVDPIKGESINQKIEFNIYFNKSPIKGKWTKHKQNPIFVDSLLSRNAGMIFKENKVYRISQKHLFNTYGSGVQINEIIKLDQSNYIEQKTNNLNIDINLKKIHHLSNLNNFTIFDFK